MVYYYGDKYNDCAEGMVPKYEGNREDWGEQALLKHLESNDNFVNMIGEEHFIHLNKKTLGWSSRCLVFFLILMIISGINWFDTATVCSYTLCQSRHRRRV